VTAVAIRDAIAAGDTTAGETVAACLARIEAANPKLGAFTDVTATRALAKAEAIDAARARGETLPPLAGVTFAAKNLFDIEGIATVAGSAINRAHAPASADSPLIARLEAAGAILTGALNMGEYAYDFTGENRHYGPSRNPHDTARMSGGSSGGSGSAVASGMVPLALGSDTNGSIRVPSSLCGIFGLKPTYGRLSRAGSFPFVASFDHLGPFASDVTTLALAYDAMQGPDDADHAQSKRPADPAFPSLRAGVAGLRIATLGGYFRENADPIALQAVDTVAEALGATAETELPHAETARASAYLITTTEGANLHLDRLRGQPGEFDPDVRDRLIAGAMVPAAWVARAQRFRAWFRREAARLFGEYDLLLAPATPCQAPLIGQKTMVLGGKEMLVRPNLGLYTQPISFIGLPVAAVPLWFDGNTLPIGVQIIAAPWREDLALRAAFALEAAGVAAAPTAPGFA
jgi:aspartyl-tRNA(Asn)/glutamyl-tRNA(Gln) amidotransferase subunit A